MDPLRRLRDAVIRDELDSVVADDENITFGDQISFPKKLETSYKSQRGKGNFYSLEVLLFYMTKGRQLAPGAYMQEANKTQLQAVSFIDRKDLLDFLQGVTDTSDYIQITVPVMPTVLPSADDDEFSLKRKQPEADPEDATPVLASRVIVKRFRPLKDRNSVLNAPKHNFKKVLDLLNKQTHGANPQSIPQQPPRAARYNDAKEQVFWQNKMGDSNAMAELGIDPNQSMADSNLSQQFRLKPGQPSAPEPSA
eukprot:CAMPEP_0198213576 /NCGR_PEP_ID=MMETSP1445-20131203/28947_1 /TAXON_ID=36898 /ORGANISM="Pyramimonas sp., Strain CCMP2087" /LENGTH=251 /DNA_ID=CAMNT_0043888239 /DNA_START=278 /DNA_END=1029 /DNA_ORIENTATION=+